MNYRDGQTEVIQPARCQELRRKSTDTERLLWQQLRNRQLAGAKFRRQHQFGPYILDFFCPARRLVVEVDGDQHQLPERLEYDAARSAYLERAGLTVLRFSNREVSQEMDGVLDRIWQLVDVVPHPDPLPEGEGNDALGRTASA